jgi:hypothetical protein
MQVVAVWGIIGAGSIPLDDCPFGRYLPLPAAAPCLNWQLEIGAGLSSRAGLFSKPELHALRYTMNNDKSRDAAPEQKRGCQECPAQRASGIEPAMAAKGNRDVSL